MKPETKALINMICEKHSVPYAAVFQRSRRKGAVKVRKDVATMLYMRGYTISQIARTLGKAHTTIIYYLQEGKDNGSNAG